MLPIATSSREQGRTCQELTATVQTASLELAFWRDGKYRAIDGDTYGQHQPALSMI
jgi:hypothetical protein